MKPNEFIDMKKYEEKREEMVFPIIKENANKKETPKIPISEKKVETTNASNDQKIHSNKDEQDTHPNKDDTSYQDKYEISSMSSEKD